MAELEADLVDRTLFAAAAAALGHVAASGRAAAHRPFVAAGLAAGRLDLEVAVAWAKNVVVVAVAEAPTWAVVGLVAEDVIEAAAAASFVLAAAAARLVACVDVDAVP